MLTESPTTSSQTRRGTGFWLALAGLFTAVIAALPFIFMREEPHYMHLAFHLTTIPLCVLGIWLYARVRRTAPNRTLRVATWVITVALAVFMFGHIGELAVVLLNGGPNAVPELFDAPAHVFFANFAVFSWMASVVFGIGFQVMAGIRKAYRSLHHDAAAGGLAAGA